MIRVFVGAVKNSRNVAWANNYGLPNALVRSLEKFGWHNGTFGENSPAKLLAR